MRYTAIVLKVIVFLLLSQPLAKQASGKYLQPYHHYDSLLRLLDVPGTSSSKMIEVGELVVESLGKNPNQTLAKGYEAIAMGYIKQNRFQSAINQFVLAQKIYLSLSDSAEYSRVLNRVGICYFRLLQHDKAIETLRNALEIRESIGDTIPIASTLNNLALCFKATKQLDAAISTYSKSYQLYSAINDLQGQSFSLNNLGQLYTETDDYQKASDAFLQSIEYKFMLNDTSGIANSYTNLGVLFSKQERYPEALGYFLKSVNLFLGIDNQFGLASTYINIAELYLKTGKPNSAYAYIEKSKLLVDIGENRSHGARILKLLSDYHLAKGNIQKSRELLFDYTLRLESHFSERISSQIAELSFMYDNERQEKEKKILQGEVEIEKLKAQKARYLFIALTATSLSLFGLLMLSLYFMRKQRDRNNKIVSLNAQLNHVNQHLESIVDRRTQDLVVALKKAQQSDVLKSAFLANMSHEVRTPLNGILGFSKLLLDETLSADSRKQYIDIINRRGRSLLQIINDIINISLLDSGQLEVRETSFNLNQLLYDLYTIFSSQDYGKKKYNVEIKLVLSLSDSRSNIVCDPSRLEQILTNLIDNALKFTSNGTVEVGYYINDSNSIQFFVKDTGVGISPERQAHVFNRFNKDDKNSPYNPSGSGLGLPLCKGIVSLLNGSIWFESQVDVGSSFFFTIPYLPVAKDANSYVSRSSISSQSIDFEGKTILVVEDDLISYQFIEALLGVTNAKLIHAKNGEDAIDICTLIPEIDLVLMDIRLPFIDGYEATAAIKANNSKLTVIAQTANVMTDDKEKCLKVGCDDYISKPIDPDELLRVVAHFLKKPNYS